MPVAVGNIEVHMGPQEQGGPDSLQDPIIDFIDRARNGQTLQIAVQEIDLPLIGEAVARARVRGVTVNLLLEQSYLRAAKRPRSLPAGPGGSHQINRNIASRLLQVDTDLKLDFNTDIFHQKFMIRGNSVLTGSTNFTQTGVRNNLNHVVVVDSAKVANAYKAEFREMWQGRFGRRSIDRDEKPIETRVSGIRVKPLFAPDHSPEMEITKQINKARSRIDFAVFTFSNSSGIDDALIRAQTAGVTVRGLLDRRMGNQSWAPFDALSDSGVDLQLIGGRGGGTRLGKLHHKLMVIDDQLTIFGSFNYTGPANTSNDENILIVGDLDESDAAARTDQAIVAQAARDEIDRIRTRFR